MMEHSFTSTIKQILERYFGDEADEVFERSYILQYLNLKTKSANRGSKARGSFANHYALYVLVEDYLNKGFDQKSGYSDYEGAKYSDLFKRQRELPFGSKLQNHALNHRLNQEFRKFFPVTELVPILRDVERYWLNQNLILVELSSKETVNIAQPILDIIDAYIDAKRNAFDSFLLECQRISQLETAEYEEVRQFIRSLLEPNVDARLFEITSFAILKASYSSEHVYWGWSWDDIHEEQLILYKTGRTNANDGGIDFVMRPLGRFFQVTETVDVKKYFLDIDKIQRFPLTFVIKSDDAIDELLDTIRLQAERQFAVTAIVERYIDCIEEIINIPTLVERFDEAVANGMLREIMDELVTQSRLEFNVADES